MVRAENDRKSDNARGKLEPFPNSRFARLQPPDVESTVLQLDHLALHTTLFDLHLFANEALAHDAEDEPSRVVRLAVEASEPAEVDVLGGIAVGRGSEACRVRRAVMVHEVILQDLDHGVDRREVIKQRFERPGGRRGADRSSCIGAGGDGQLVSPCQYCDNASLTAAHLGTPPQTRRQPPVDHHRGEHVLQVIRVSDPIDVHPRAHLFAQVEPTGTVLGFELVEQRDLERRKVGREVRVGDDRYGAQVRRRRRIDMQERKRVHHQEVGALGLDVFGLGEGGGVLEELLVLSDGGPDQAARVARYKLVPCGSLLSVCRSGWSKTGNTGLTHLNERENQTRLERVLVRFAIRDLEPAVHVHHELAITARDQLALQAEVLLLFLLPPVIVRGGLFPIARTASKTEQSDVGGRADSDRTKGEDDAPFRRRKAIQSGVEASLAQGDVERSERGNVGRARCPVGCARGLRSRQDMVW